MRERIVFENRMTRLQAALGWIYLPVHILVLPLLLSLYASVSPDFDEVSVNLVYHGAGIVFVLCVMLPYLRGQFDMLLDHPGLCLMTLALCFAAVYVFSVALGALFLYLLEDLPENPNNAAVAALAGQNYGVIRALSVFLGPVTEEVLFRGVAFGTLRKRSRLLAYSVSALLFGIYHVWQFVLLYADPMILLYTLQYLPFALLLDRCYERSGSLWTCIFFHMSYNAMAFLALSML